jgi:hypothetical protein
MALPLARPVAKPIAKAIAGESPDADGHLPGDLPEHLHDGLGEPGHRAKSRLYERVASSGPLPPVAGYRPRRLATSCSHLHRASNANTKGLSRRSGHSRRSATRRATQLRVDSSS